LSPRRNPVFGCRAAGGEYQSRVAPALSDGARRRPVAIGLYAVSDTAIEDQHFNSAQAIIFWDPDGAAN
jgi:hypothetical protein